MGIRGIDKLIFWLLKLVTHLKLKDKEDKKLTKNINIKTICTKSVKIDRYTYIYYHHNRFIFINDKIVI